MRSCRKHKCAPICLKLTLKTNILAYQIQRVTLYQRWAIMITRRAAFEKILKPRAARPRMSDFPLKCKRTAKKSYHVRTVAQRKILKGGGHSFLIFSSVFFFGRTNLKLIEEQERLQGVRGHTPPKNL